MTAPQPASVATGVGAGAVAGAAVGLAEALWVVGQASTGEYAALLHGPVVYGALGAGAGLVLGLVGALPARLGKRPGRTAATAWAATALVVGGVGALGVMLDQAAAAAGRPLGVGGLAGLGLVWAVGLLAGAWLLPALLTRTPAAALSTTRGSLALLTGTVLLAGAFSLSPRSAQPRAPASALEDDRPDVVIVAVRGLRADLGAGIQDGRAATPNLDALAADGVRFSQTYGHAAALRPSLASVLTGSSTARHDLVGGHLRLEDGAVTLAEVLGGAGYATSAVVASLTAGRASNLHQGFERYRWHAPTGLWLAAETTNLLAMSRRVRPWVRRGLGALHRLEDHHAPAAAVIQALPAASEDPRARFWFVELAEPGGPWFGAGPDRDVVWPDPWVRGDVGGVAAARARRAYLAEVERVDAALGVLLDRLRAEGRYAGAAIAVLGTHGVELGEHGAVSEGGSQHAELLRVPLVLKLPEGERAGTVVPTRVRLSDIAPTLLEVVGLEPPDAWDGRTLVPLLDGDGVDRPVLSLHQGRGAVMCGLRDQGWTYLLSNRGSPRGLAAERLYATADDPDERRNLLSTASRERAQLRETLRGRIELAAPDPVQPARKAWLELVQDPVPAGPPGD